MIDFIKQESVQKICKYCGFYKNGICDVSKQKKSAENECDVHFPKTKRKVFLYKGGIITKNV